MTVSRARSNLVVFCAHRLDLGGAGAAIVKLWALQRGVVLRKASQGAQAIRDPDLIEMVSHCHAQTLRGMKWTVTRIKAAAPQILASSRAPL